VPADNVAIIAHKKKHGGVPVEVASLRLRSLTHQRPDAENVGYCRKRTSGSGGRQLLSRPIIEESRFAP
jgi:hypothetical protein